MYFKTWKKKENIFSAHYKLHLRILTLISFVSFLSFAKKTRARDAHATQFCSWKRLLESLSLLTLLVITNSAILYARSTYLSSILSHSPVLPFTLAFSISTRSIYLSTISLLYILPPAIQCFMDFTLCTFFSTGLWRKRVGYWPN